MAAAPIRPWQAAEKHSASPHPTAVPRRRKALAAPAGLVSMLFIRIMA